jgi:hypothetical protein
LKQRDFEIEGLDVVVSSNKSKFKYTVLGPEEPALAELGMNTYNHY